VGKSVCVCVCMWAFLSGHACLQLLPLVETFKSTGMERCHSGDIHAGPHVAQRPRSGLDSPHRNAPIHRVEGGADAKMQITTLT